MEAHHPLFLLLLLLINISRSSSSLRGSTANYSSNLAIRNGYINDTFVGTYTSQLQAFIKDNYAPMIEEEVASITMANGTALRYLSLDGDYKADVPLSLPSLLVLKLQGSITPAANLTAGKTRFGALVQQNGTRYSAVIGGTIDASSLPVRGDEEFGYMALSITGGSMNSIRNVRAMANNSDSVIGINLASHSEVSDCVVGGDDGDLGMLQTRCIWTLATETALIHDNHVKYCSTHR